jgi:hypothetical protein
VSPSLALANAARNEPGPLSRVFCTVFVHPVGAYERKGVAHNKPRVKDKPKMFLLPAWFSQTKPGLSM